MIILKNRIKANLPVKIIGVIGNVKTSLTIKIKWIFNNN
jgi:hypothetical protein